MARPGVTLDVADVQGLVVRGYGRLPHAHFLACAVHDPGSARRLLGDLLAQVTNGVGHGDAALNVAFTAPGLIALGLPADVVEGGFAAPFVEGMTTAHRQRLLGDVGPTDPRGWAWGGPDTAPVHLLLLLYAATAQILAERRDALLAAAAGALDVVADLPTDALGDTEAFGFRDGMSQPRLAGLPRDPGGRTVPTGEFVLGYPNAYGQLGPRPLLDPVTDPQRLLPRDPGGSGAADLGKDGSYLVRAAAAPGRRRVRGVPARASRGRRGGPGAAGRQDGRSLAQRRPAGARARRGRPTVSRTPTSATTPRTRTGWRARSARTSAGPTRATRCRRRRAASGRCD